MLGKLQSQLIQV